MHLARFDPGELAMSTTTLPAAMSALEARFGTQWGSTCKVIWPNTAGGEAARPQRASEANLAGTITGSLTVTLATRRMVMAGAFANLNQRDVFALSGTASHNRTFTIKEKVSEDEIEVAAHDTIAGDETAPTATLVAVLDWLEFSLIPDADEQAFMSGAGTGIRTHVFPAMQIFVPLGGGSSALWTLAAAAVAIWRAKVISDSIHFSSRTRYGPPIRTGDHWMLTVSSPGYFEETIAA